MTSGVYLESGLHFLLSAFLESKRKPIPLQIAATDKKTDELVCQFHELTEEEIRIVEAAALH